MKKRLALAGLIALLVLVVSLVLYLSGHDPRYRTSEDAILAAVLYGLLSFFIAYILLNPEFQSVKLKAVGQEPGMREQAIRVLAPLLALTVCAPFSGLSIGEVLSFQIRTEVPIWIILVSIVVFLTLLISSILCAIRRDTAALTFIGAVILASSSFYRSWSWNISPLSDWWFFVNAFLGISLVNISGKRLEENNRLLYKMRLRIVSTLMIWVAAVLFSIRPGALGGVPYAVLASVLTVWGLLALGITALVVIAETAFPLGYSLVPMIFLAALITPMIFEKRLKALDSWEGFQRLRAMLVRQTQVKKLLLSAAFVLALTIIYASWIIWMGDDLTAWLFVIIFMSLMANLARRATGLHLASLTP